MTDGGPLSGVRVVDVSDDLGCYAARLLADLGADVVRIDPPDAVPLGEMEPLIDVDQRRISLFERFCNTGKRIVDVALETREGATALWALLAEADVLIESSWTGQPLEIAPDVNPRLVRVIVTPFGRGMDAPSSPVDDLIVLGAGGLLALGGYRDRGPVAAWGGQSRYAASIYAAVSALVGLIHRNDRGGSVTFDVSAQECMAQALEDSVPTFALTGEEREHFGEASREAGSGTYSCLDGRVSMIAGRLGTARAWSALVEWMNEEEAVGASALCEPRWSVFEFRQTPEAIGRFREVFESFAATKSKQELYHEAQRRGIALSPINGVSDLFENPQLLERSFFTVQGDDGADLPLVFPGPPYSLSLTPARIGDAPKALRSMDLSWLPDVDEGSPLAQGAG